MSESNRKIRVAMIGAGRITDLHYPAYRGFDRAEFKTVCDASEETARRRHREWGTRDWSTDWRAVLADPEIDMVEINTPHPLHHPMVLAAAEAGKHVQVQKPFGMNLRECREMIDACRKAGVCLKVMENFVFYPPYLRAKALLDRGEIGELKSIRLRIGSAGLGGWYVPLDTWIWRLRETDLGGGPVIFDDGYHKFSLGQFFGGPAVEVFAWIDRSFTLIDAPAVVTWRSERGVLGVIDATFSPNLHVKSNYYSADERVELTGTKGTIWVTRCTGQLFDEPPLILFREGERIAYEDLKTDWVESFTGSTRHFIGVLLDGGEPILTGETALEVQRFSFAAIRSAREGRPVRPEEMEEFSA